MTVAISRRVGVLVGSLRRGSFSRKLAKALVARAPKTLACRFIEIGDLPLYNEDLDSAPPKAWSVFRESLKACDALLFVTPEYNYGVPGVLKNAIDWVSRPPDTQPFNGKPVAILGASAGVMGTVRSQQHLRQTLMSLNMLPVNVPEVLIGQAAKRFDAQGRLTDEATGKFIAQLMQALWDWTLRLQK